MKTKNIFRMLLVAVALLLGANNAKAETIVLWESDNAEGTELNYGVIPISQANLEKMEVGDKICFYGNVRGTNGCYLGIYTPNNNLIVGTTWSSDPFTNGVAEWAFTSQDNINNLITYSWNQTETYLAEVRGNNVTLTKIELVKVDGFAINISNTNGGSVSVDKAKAPEGEVVTITTTPYEGYELSSISVINDTDNSAVNVVGNTFTMPASSVTVSATFAYVNYSISVDDNVTVSNTTGHIGETISVTAADAPDGYVFECFIVKGDNNQYYQVNNGTFQMPATNVTVTALYKIEVTGSTTETSIWTGSVTLNWNDWNNGHVDYSTSELCNATAGDIVRIYGSKPNNDWFNVKLENINNTELRLIPWNSNLTASWATSEETYIEFIITQELISLWSSVSSGAINGWNFTITDMKWLHNDGSASSKTDVTLTYSASTASATTASIGQTLANAPTLTVSPEGLEGVTYSSSNTDVATVAADGTVTIAGAGTTTITATFIETDTHKGASASYTLTVTEATYAITLSETTNGQLSASPAADVTAGTTVTITATPSEGYKLSAITVTGADETNIEVSGTGNTRTFTMPSQDVTVSATFAEIETVEAVVTSTTGFATFCSNKALDFTGINTIEAYYAKTIENGNVYLLRVYGTVKAGTGLVLKGATTRIPVAESGDELEGNMLIGVSENTDVNASTDYVLTEKDGAAVFAQTGENKATVEAGHAYLRVSAAQARTRTIGIGGEGTTGIENTFIDDNESGEKVIYNLSGQRVKNVTKGIYIINGKKVLVK